MGSFRSLALGLVSLFGVVLVFACSSSGLSERGDRVFYSENIEHAVDYLRSRYNRSQKLVAEAQGPGGWELSPPGGGEARFWTMDRIYWLGDNSLAALALLPYEPDMSEAIARRVESFGEYARDDKPDVLAGRRISDTPWIKQRVTVEQSDNFITVGAKNTEDILAPLDEYADVSLYYSILAWRSGNEKYAKQLLHQVLGTWDGKGIWDGPARFYDEYAVYKLAMLLIALQVIQEPFQDFDKIERLMWQNQDSEGGIVTGISREGFTVGGPNTETTSLVLLVYDEARIAELRKRF